MKIKFEFPEGAVVVKDLDDSLSDKQLYGLMLIRTKEAYRDYLFARYGDKWREHDAGAGKFWG